MEKRARTLYWMEFSIDALSLVLSFLIAFFALKFNTNKIVDVSTLNWVIFYAVLAVSFLSSYFLFHTNIDVHHRNRFFEIVNIVKNNSLVFLIFMALLVFIRNPIITFRALIITAYFISLAISALFRYYLKHWLTGNYSSINNKIATYVGVITTVDRAEEFVSQLKEDWSIKVTGVALLDNFVNNGRFVYDNQLELGSEYGDSKVATRERVRFPHVVAQDVPVIATDIRFINWIRSSRLDEVFINLPYASSNDVAEIVEELESMGVTVHINIPSLDQMLDESRFDNINCKVYAGYPLATFQPAIHSAVGLGIKRIMDVLGAIVGLLISIPIILVTAIPLLIESPGPLFFKQERVGRNGKTFKIYKLRSMYKDAEARKKELMKHNKMDGLMFKMDDDPRITKVGKFIRKFSIDELPQFFNVLKGDMSLVGTRPPTVKEFEQYENRHKRRLSMRPGITGKWQVSGRSDIQDFEEVVRLDCEYIDNWSIGLDIAILLKTVKVVLTHEGAE